MAMTGALGTQEVARRLADLLGKAPRDAPVLQPFDPLPPPRRAVAVDGSHVVLAEAGDTLLAAHRWGRVRLHDGRPLAPEPQPPEVVLLSKADASDAIRARLSRHGFVDPVLSTVTPTVALDLLRTLGEFACAEDALRHLEHGDLLLLDGALQARQGLPLLDRLLQAAKERGVDVVGVCKSTSMTIGPVPALVACQLAARGTPHATWWAPLGAKAGVRGTIVAARLGPAEERPFRFDVAAPDGDVPRVLGRLASFAGHPAYPGYPSPLAMAHNAALLNEETRRALRAELMEAAIRAGAPEEAWAAAFLDYHDILELGA